MHVLARRHALRAAAKAALSVTFLGGCGGATLTGTLDEKTDSAAPRPEASRAPEADTRAACDVPSLPSREVVSEEAFACCMTSVDGMLGDSGSLPGANEYWSPAIPCCSAIITRLDDHALGPAPNDLDWQAVLACCQTLADHGFSNKTVDGGFGACDPWGPPVPPEMPADWLEVA